MTTHRAGAFTAGFTTKPLKRGDIVWLQLPQDLAAANDPRAVTHKTRPFIILNERINLCLDHRGHCIRSEKLIGVDGTSQDWLVEGRPHVAFTMDGKNKQTYALLDSLRTVDSHHQRFAHVDILPPSHQMQLATGLDNVLRPEQRFYLKRWYNNKLLPGEIWNFEVPTRHGTAMVLLRRGQFFTDGYDEGGRNDSDSRQHKSRFTPYLVAAFRQAEIKTLRGISWKEVDVMALHERSFVNQQHSLTEETVGIFLNNLRARIGLLPITYNRPTIKSATGNPLWQFLVGGLRL